MWIAAAMFVNGDALAQDKPLQVKGRVVDEEFKPLPGVRLTALLADEYFRSSVDGERLGVTDAKGGFSVRIPARKVRRHPSLQVEYLLFEVAGRLSARIIPGVWNPYMSTAVSQGEYDAGTIVLPAGEPIQVRIRKAGGRPLAGAVVTSASPLRPAMSVFSLGSRRAPEYVGRVVTDEKGRGVIYGHGPDGVSLVVRAYGYYTRRIALHGPKMPLVVQMEPGGTVAGRVVDEAGGPTDAMIMINWEVAGVDFSELVFGRRFTNPDGSFELNLEHPQRFVIVAYPLSSGSFSNNNDSALFSDTLTGPQKDLKLQREKSRGSVALTVVGAKSEAAVKDSRVVMFWGDRVPLEVLDMQFGFLARDVPVGGKIVLPLPKGNETTGSLMVKAPGYAPFVLEGVKWDENKPPSITARLVEEIPVSGVVRDPAGKPIADVEVWTMPVKKKGARVSLPGGARLRVVLSDAKGRFELHGLGNGKYDLSFAHAAHASAKPKRIELQGKPFEATLVLQPGVRVVGKVLGATVGRGWQLVLSQGQPQSGPFRMGGGSPARTFASPIDAEGKVTWRGLQPGSYHAALSIPRRTGQRMEIPMTDKIEIAKGATAIDIDIGALVPGRLKGTLTCRGLPPLPGRLVVTATRAAEAGGRMFPRAVIQGPWCTVARDGSFEIPLAPGKCTLTVIDASNGVTLLQDTVVIQAGKITTKALKLELTLVRVRLLPATDGGDVVASRLQVVLQLDGQGEQGRDPFAALGLPASGVPLADGRREVLLYLPAAPTKLSVVTNAEKLRSMPQPGASTTSLGAAEFTPKLGEIHRVEIKVKPPPPVGSKR